MAGRGRPPVNDKRTNQYRVLMNDEEDRMLDYCSKATGLRKSEIFRKGIGFIYQQIQLNKFEQGYKGYVGKQRMVRCPYCDAENVIDFDQYITDAQQRSRKLGFETKHIFRCENRRCCSCGRPFTAEGYISEYPAGVYDTEHIEVHRPE